MKAWSEKKGSTWGHDKTFPPRPYDNRSSYDDRQHAIDFRRLKDRLKPCLLTLLRDLLPKGQVEGQEYVALNPTRSDKSLGSFRMNIRTGKWADFATGDKGGDLIALWAYVKGIKQGEAARQLLAKLGGDR